MIVVIGTVAVSHIADSPMSLDRLALILELAERDPCRAEGPHGSYYRRHRTDPRRHIAPLH